MVVSSSSSAGPVAVAPAVTGQRDGEPAAGPGGLHQVSQRRQQTRRLDDRGMQLGHAGAEQPGGLGQGHVDAVGCVGVAGGEIVELLPCAQHVLEGPVVEGLSQIALLALLDGDHLRQQGTAVTEQTGDRLDPRALEPRQQDGAETDGGEHHRAQQGGTTAAPAQRAG